MEVNNKQNILAKLERYLSNWKWILLSVLLSFTIAYFYQKYLTRIYKASTVILINDTSKGGFNSEISAFTDKFSVYNQNKVSLANELEFVSSRKNIESTIKELNLNINYNSDGNIKGQNLYKKSPVKIIFTNPLIQYESYLGLIVLIKENNKFELLDSNEEQIGTYIFGEKISYNNISFTIIKNPGKSSLTKIEIFVNPVKNLIESYKSRIKSKNIDTESSICDISITDDSPERAIDFLNALVQ